MQAEERNQLNVFGQPLEHCCRDPVTGFYRDGFCHTGPQDSGTHTVCAHITEAFLLFSTAAGNDLSTPRLEFRFPGLSEGDRWCLCARRWLQAYEHDKAPRIYLRATNQATLDIVSLEHLKPFALDLL